MPRRLRPRRTLPATAWDSGGRVAVYTCRADGTPGTLIRVTGIYTNLLPENDALRIKRGLVVNSPRELDLLLEDLGE